MEVTGSRLLSGPSLWLDGPGAVADVRLSDGDPDPVPTWQAALKRAHSALGWPRRAHSRRSGDDFIALAIEAPPSCLASAARLNDWAIAGGPEEELRALAEQVAAASRPEPLAAIAEAKRREVPWLLDEIGLTVGLGSGAVTVIDGSEGRSEPNDPSLWPIGRVAARCEEIPWDALHPVPVVVVTGTTGTTATARLLARIATLAGHTAGLACADGAEVGGEALAVDDPTAPAATRRVLRDPRVTFVILETPVAGALTHGLVLPCADVAIVTGITVDPPGDHGVTTRQHLVEATLAVAKAARHLVLNADDPLLSESRADSWFSADRPVEGAFIVDGELVCGEKRMNVRALGEAGRDDTSQDLGHLLAAAAAARAAGLPVKAIAEAMSPLVPTPHLP